MGGIFQKLQMVDLIHDNILGNRETNAGNAIGSQGFVGLFQVGKTDLCAIVFILVVMIPGDGILKISLIR